MSMLDREVSDLKLLTGFFCEICGFKEFQLGLASKSECLCMESESQCKCKKPTTCIKCQSVDCCCDCRSAIPCDSDVPCTLALCGLVCYGGGK